MAEVSVKEFSETVGTPIDRLLSQLNEAGLPHVAEADLLSDQDKERLLSYLRRVHGKDDDGPGRSPRKKITLKRRQVSEISIAPSPRETRGPGGGWPPARGRSRSTCSGRAPSSGRRTNRPGRPSRCSASRKRPRATSWRRHAPIGARSTSACARTTRPAPPRRCVGARSGSAKRCASGSWPRRGPARRRPGRRRRPPRRPARPHPRRPSSRRPPRPRRRPPPSRWRPRRLRPPPTRAPARPQGGRPRPPEP